MDYGDRNMIVLAADGAHTFYPSNGRGGNTQTAASSECLGRDQIAVPVQVTGILVTVAPGSASVLTLKNHAGTSQLAIPIPTTIPCPYPIPIGGKDGQGIDLGLAVDVSVAMSFALYYKRAETGTI